MSDFGDSVRKLLMAGIGAAALTVEKSKELIDSLSVKGEEVAAQGKAAGEDIMRRVSERIDRIAEQLRERKSGGDEFDDLLDLVPGLTAEQKAALLRKLAEAAEAEAAREAGCDCGCEDEEDCDCGCEDEEDCDCGREAEEDCGCGCEAEEDCGCGREAGEE